MAKISLRIYRNEIENLINRGQLEEAIAHCKYILTIYPKYVDAYRLLAKAFLESQKYSDAGDIFQRVLSVVPDDFISQIGTSIVKENAGDLDGAIWHMERAFETQPSNTPVQQELKRLYGRRDGVEPLKIRLTKGVLVRMYARSRLFPQAIAEAQAALAEDPSRTDIELILAQMYFQSNQKLDATESASKVVTKLPFCLEANRILSEVLLNTTRSEDARKYRERVNSLDPYAKFVSGAATFSEDVPDNAVTLERLVWQSGLSAVSYPDLALADFAPTTSSTPAVLAPSEEENKTALVSASELDRQTENMIPDWMKTGGWNPADHPLINEQPIKSIEPVAEPAEIPDWLKEISLKDPGSTEVDSKAQNSSETRIPPVIAQENASSASPTSSSEVPEWLRSTLDALPEEPSAVNEPQIPVVKGTAPIPEIEISEGNLPSWMKEIKSQPVFDSDANESNAATQSNSENFEQPQADVNMPWLDSISNEALPTPTPPSSLEEKESSPWLKEMTVEDSSPSPEAEGKSEELPEWLREIDITPEGEESLKHKPQTTPLANQIPEWLQDLKNSAPPEPEVDSIPSNEVGASLDESSQTDLKNWLSSLETPDTLSSTEFSPAKYSERTPSLERKPTENEPIEVKIEDPGRTKKSPKNEEPLVDLPENFDHFIPSQIIEAEKAIASNNLAEALKEYRQLIHSGTSLDATVTSIKKELEKNASEAALWQILGDAYSKSNKLREALAAYNKAEQCLN